MELDRISAHEVSFTACEGTKLSGYTICLTHG